MELTETACYLGASLSASIAKKIYGMHEKTFINKMFLWYFAVDAIMGSLNTFLLFRVQRFVFKLQKLNYILMKRLCVCACATSCYLIIEYMSVEPKWCFLNCSKGRTGIFLLMTMSQIRGYVTPNQIHLLFGIFVKKCAKNTQIKASKGLIWFGLVW